jgi:electron transfer flavoprotein beta subunit
MKIIVTIKQILDPAGLTIRRDKERLFVNREEYIVDPASKAAIEAALRVRDAVCARGAEGDEGATGAHVIALCQGQAQADDALREALALGCDQAYLLCDSAFDHADIGVTARILAAAVEKLGGADLIVTGDRSADTGAGQIGPRLAGALAYSQVTGVVGLAVEADRLRATRRWDAGPGVAYATVEAALPAVASVVPEAFPPRYAHGARIMNAYREWEVVVWDAATLDLDPDALRPSLVFRGEGFPPPLEVERYQGDPAGVARDAALALRLQKLV